MDITIQNNLLTALNNTKVTIQSASPNIDCISDPQALYGTLASGAVATNPSGDRFTFHVAPAVTCTDFQNPPSAQFIVTISGDGLDGSATLQSFVVAVDLDATASGGAYTLTQNFAANPGWATGTTPDDTGTCAPAYLNEFHWCAACGNGGGGYGAWVGNSPFGTSGQNYTSVNSSTLYSPPLVASGTMTVQFDVAYRTEPSFDGAIVQAKVAAGAWADVPFVTPAQGTTTAQDTCSPLFESNPAWTGAGVSWTTTDAASVAASNGDAVQFRWRLGGDSSVVGTSFGGYGVDNVVITNLKQTQVCEPTRNTGLPACPFCLSHVNGTACDDGNPCTISETCTGGACAGGTVITAPAEAQNVSAAADKVTYSWTATPAATRYDVLRGDLASFPVGPGGGDESCFDNLASPSLTDSTIPSAGTGFWYLSRGENTCGNGTYGTQSNLTPRVSTTCP
jgi:hypothetical protein